MVLLEKLIGKLKKDKSYKWDSRYDIRDIFIIGVERLKQLMRGMIVKPFFKESKGLLFIGSSVKIKHKHKIEAGENLIIDDYVYVNAISEGGVKFGNDVSIARFSILMASHVVSHQGKGITIGNGTGINARVFIGGQGGVSIGNNVIIGPDVKIFSENHRYVDLQTPIAKQGVIRSSVIIGDNCWIGAGAIILAGVTLGPGSVIAAGSVVTKSFPNNVVLGGVPARIMKNRE